MFIEEEVRTIKTMPSKMRPKLQRAENEEEKKLPRTRNENNVVQAAGIANQPNSFVHYHHMNHNCHMS